MVDMKKSNLLLWIPTLLGCLLLLVSYFDLQQFNVGKIVPREMVGREAPLVLLGFLSSIIVLIFFFMHLFKKKWSQAVQSIVSIILFLTCFYIGGILGAAYLNAA
jgi:hypothetical protein